MTLSGSHLSLLVVMLAGCSSPDNSAPASVWCDPDTRLCWQNPQREGYAENDTGLIASAAVVYCETFVLGGYDDWRLPGIDELRSIVAGNADTSTNGACIVTTGAGTAAGLDSVCHGSSLYQGPGTHGCYWKQGLSGRCDKPDPAAEGHPLETWARDRAVDDPENWTAYVAFETGATGFNHSCSYADVRCVRDNDGYMPDCIASGACEDSSPFVANAELTAACDADVCAGSDGLRVTLQVPEKLARPPHRLSAFYYYDDESWSMPPNRPPDGGTDHNFVMSPDIDDGRPLTMTIPACTYYREKALDGHYRLYVHLQMSEEFPPSPKDGDYWWASAEPVQFPLNGKTHESRIESLDIVLRPVP